jgi:hypothetical protein
MLTLVRDTFPTYTLHNERHSENVVKVMEKLLGDKSGQLGALEAALLLLAAYFHDIGMVYSEEELSEIPRQQEFKEYLDSNPSAYLATTQNADQPPSEVLEGFCRARHADRVYVHLNRIAGDLRWDTVPLVDALGSLCRSHNTNTVELKDDIFDTDFLAECDLRFCAIILRIADILDFDKTRSPKAIYEHLKLASHASAKIAASDKEWRKHLCSNGFAFPSERTSNYHLKYIAAPDSPAVEHDVRSFLDIIDRELGACEKIRGLCSARWRDLPLPVAVDRRNIISDGYKYGDFKFELDRTSVLELFMGERLYADRYVFIRELMQNSIDATRLRSVLHENSEFDQTVSITAWTDDSGFAWIRIDDSGVGMDEHIVRNYFLRVGRSSYQSAETRAAIARQRPSHGDFVAISRFGIGILSCFTVADRVEVLTRRILEDGSLATPLRLSASKAEDFFVLQEPPMLPSPLPGRFGAEKSYRQTPGTSIALRVNPLRTAITLDLIRNYILSYAICPPVQIRFNNEITRRFGFESVSSQPLKEPKQIELQISETGDGFYVTTTISGKEVSRFRADEPRRPTAFTYMYRGGVRINEVPLDVTRWSPTPLLQGQLVALHVEPLEAVDAESRARHNDFLRFCTEEQTDLLPTSIAKLLQNAESRCRSYLSRDESGIVVTIEQQLVTSVVEEALTQARVILAAGDLVEEEFNALSALVERLRSGLSVSPYQSSEVRTHIPLDMSLLEISTFLDADTFGVTWCHNGIAIPAPKNSDFSRGNRDKLGLVNFGRVSNSDLRFVGILTLRDRLRPDVSVSRDHIIDIPFEIHSALQLAVRRAATPYLGGPLAHLALRLMVEDLLPRSPARFGRLGDFLDDPLLSESGWLKEDVISVNGSLGEGRSRLSVLELRQEHELNYEQFFGSYTRFDGRAFYALILNILAQVSMDIAWSCSTSIGARLMVLSANRPSFERGLGVFRPLLFVPYLEDDVNLRFSNCPSVNLSHPLSKWIVENAVRLDAEAPILLMRMVRILEQGPKDGDVQELNEAIADICIALPEIAVPVPDSVVADDKLLWRSGS